MKKLLILAAVTCLLSDAWAFSKIGTVYTTDGSLADVQGAVNDATAGDTVQIPEGTFVWGANGSYLNVSKAITVEGLSRANTIIHISTTAGNYGSATIRVSNGAIIRNFTVSPLADNKTPISIGGFTPPYARVTEINNSPAVGINSYFVYGGGYGLIDNCNVVGGRGDAELIFTRGPTNAWQTPHTMGTAEAIIIEDCVFSGSGYVSDFNANSRAVVRFTTIEGQMKIDTHGVSTNSPPRSGRQTEAYRNTWTVTGVVYYTSFEIRGGTGIIFDNTATNTAPSHWFGILDYGYKGIYTNYGNGSIYGTPTWYPLKDQIGVGMDPKVAGSEPMYLINNKKGSGDWGITWSAVAGGAITQYRTEIDDETATFAMFDVIKANTDYFKHNVGGSFDGTSGVGRGTKAQMEAITPTLAKVGFWVTDEGTWNTSGDGSGQGQLNQWNGSAWVLYYTPLQYPHPMRGALAAPVFTVNPTTQEVVAGATVTLFASVASNPSSSYQWQQDGVNIIGATGTSLAIYDFQAANVGTYTVIATNSQGSATSSGAVLTLDDPPEPPAPEVGGNANINQFNVIRLVLP